MAAVDQQWSWDNYDWDAHYSAQRETWRQNNSQGWRDPHQEAWQEDPWNDGAQASDWTSSGWSARGGWRDNSRSPHPQRHNTTASASQPDVDMSDVASSRTPGTPYNENEGDWGEARDDDDW